MKLQNSLLMIAFVLIGCVNCVFGQADFFWSTASLNRGAVNDDLNATFESGETASLYLYYSTNGPADSDISVGAFLDIATSAAGVIEFTQAETFDFGISVLGAPVNRRWIGGHGNGSSAGETGEVSSDFIDELHAFAVDGAVGILESNSMAPFVDEGYDDRADAFLFGAIEFTVVGNPGESVELLTSAGDGQIINGDDLVDAMFGGATINVAGIPEPAAAGLLALGLTAIVGSRRRPGSK